MATLTLGGVVARYADAWNDHDPLACADCFAPGGAHVWCVRAPGRPPGSRFPRFRGRAAIAGTIGAVMLSVPDLRLDIVALAQGSDGRLWTEWSLTGTCSATRGDREARGEGLEMAGVSIFRVAAGGFQEERAYWDSPPLRYSLAPGTEPA